MPLLMLLLATTAVLAGSMAGAALVERESFSRRLLLAAVFVPAQITLHVLVVGRLFEAFRPGPLLASSLVANAVLLVAARKRHLWSGPMDPLVVARRMTAAARRHRLETAIVTVAAARTAWQAAIAIRVPVTSWDSLMYRLVEPSHWVLTGRVERSGLTIHGDGYPQGQEVLHGWTMVFLHSIRGTGLIPLWLALAAALAIYRLARHLGVARPSAMVGAAVFLTMPSAALQIGTAYVDVGAAALGLAALALALEARRSTNALALMFGACAAGGLAIAMKPSMAPALLAVVIVASALSISHHREGTPTGQLVFRWIAGLAIVTALGGVWYIANYATHRNPLYPVDVLGFRGADTFTRLASNHQAPKEIADRNPVVQLWSSWSEDLGHHPFSYDQRLGGLGAVWLLVCVPSLGLLTSRLWRRDRLALAVLVAVGVATSASTGSAWWGRSTLVLAGIGCVALASASDRLRRWATGRRAATAHRSRRVWAPAFLAATLLLVGFTTASSVSPTDAYALENTIPLKAMTPGELARMAIRGDGPETVRPWGAFTGLREAPEGSVIAYVDRSTVVFPQVLMGIDLRHPLVVLEPPGAPSDLAAEMRSAGARFLYLPDPLEPGTVETLAVSDRLHFRPFDTTQLITGGSLWEVGNFDECLGGDITVEASVTESASVVSGGATDRCGDLADAPLRLWRAGPDAKQPWKEARLVTSTIVTDDDGRFLYLGGRPELSVQAGYFVSFSGREDGHRYRPPAASDVVSVHS